MKKEKFIKIFTTTDIYWFLFVVLILSAVVKVLMIPEKNAGQYEYDSVPIPARVILHQSEVIPNYLIRQTEQEFKDYGCTHITASAVDELNAKVWCIELNIGETEEKK